MILLESLAPSNICSHLQVSFADLGWVFSCNWNTRAASPVVPWSLLFPQASLFTSWSKVLRVVGRAWHLEVLAGNWHIVIQMKS